MNAPSEASPTNAEAVETVLREDYGPLANTRAVKGLIARLWAATNIVNREGYYVEYDNTVAAFRLVDDRADEREVSPTLIPWRFADWLDGFVEGRWTRAPDLTDGPRQDKMVG